MLVAVWFGRRQLREFNMSRAGLVLLILYFIACGNVFAASCVISGCNNEICAKAGENHFSTCMWKAEYECYNKYGICEANTAGDCVWRQTPELVQCIKFRDQQVEAADAFSD